MNTAMQHFDKKKLSMVYSSSSIFREITFLLLKGGAPSVGVHKPKQKGMYASN
jgi:hypothetical protein